MSNYSAVFYVNFSTPNVNYSGRTATQQQQ